MRYSAFQPGLWPSLLTFTGIVILLILGTWQVQRLHWKSEILTLLHLQMNQPPEALPEDITRPDEWDYRRVWVEGRFLHDHEFYLLPRQYDQQTGFHLLTPFERLGGDVILVNRGFLADLDRPYDQPSGQVTVSGVAHIPDDRNVFTPENRRGDHQIYWSDLDFLSAESGLTIATSLVLYADAGTENEIYPVGGQIRLDIPNNHRQYAIFWYMMALVLAVIYTLHGFRPRKKSHKP